jgi:hypothetical protein
MLSDRKTDMVKFSEFRNAHAKLRKSGRSYVKF